MWWRPDTVPVLRKLSLVIRVEQGTSKSLILRHRLSQKWRAPWGPDAGMTYQTLGAGHQERLLGGRDI